MQRSAQSQQGKRCRCSVCEEVREMRRMRSILERIRPRMAEFVKVKEPKEEEEKEEEEEEEVKEEKEDEFKWYHLESIKRAVLRRPKVVKEMKVQQLEEIISITNGRDEVEEDEVMIEEIRRFCRSLKKKWHKHPDYKMCEYDSSSDTSGNRQAEDKDTHPGTIRLVRERKEEKEEGSEKEQRQQRGVSMEEMEPERMGKKKLQKIEEEEQMETVMEPQFKRDKILNVIIGNDEEEEDDYIKEQMRIFCRSYRKLWIDIPELEMVECYSSSDSSASRQAKVKYTHPRTIRLVRERKEEKEEGSEKELRQQRGVSMEEMEPERMEKKKLQKIEEEEQMETVMEPQNEDENITEKAPKTRMQRLRNGLRNLFRKQSHPGESEKDIKNADKKPKERRGFWGFTKTNKVTPSLE